MNTFLKAPYHIVTEVLKKSLKASKVCGVDGEAVESDDPISILFTD